MFLILTAPTIYLAWRYYCDYYALGEPLSLFEHILPITLLCFYVIFLSILGYEQSINLFRDYGVSRKIEGLWVFVLPGICVAFISFPKQVAEIAEQFYAQTSIDLHHIVRIAGIFLLAIVFFRHLIVL